MASAPDGLQIETDLRFLRREWRIQRASWIAMLLVVVAAVAGLFGNGLLSDVQAGSAESGLQVSYSRFVRMTAETTIELEVGPGVIREGQVELWISNSYLSSVDIESIRPEPSSVVTAADGATFTIHVEEPLPAPIMIGVRATEIGSHAGALGVRGGPTERVTQFVYP